MGECDSFTFFTKRSYSHLMIIYRLRHACSRHSFLTIRLQLIESHIPMQEIFDSCLIKLAPKKIIIISKDSIVVRLEIGLVNYLYFLRNTKPSDYVEVNSNNFVN